MRTSPHTLVALAVVTFMTACGGEGNDTPPVTTPTTPVVPPPPPPVTPPVNPGPDTTAPSVPAGIVVTAVGTTTATLTWNVSTDSGSAGLKDYVIYRDGNALAQVATPSYADNGLNASSTYSYRISARDNADNESAQSAAVQVTTMSAPASSDTTPPTTPGTPVATLVVSNGVTLTWTASTDAGGSGLRDYLVYRGAQSVLVGTSPTNSFVDSTVARNTSYTYQISARDNALNESARSAGLSVTTPRDPTPPTVPGNLQASVNNVGAVVLTWDLSTDTGGAGLAGYRVLRDAVEIATVARPAVTHTDATAADGTTYTYTVRAYDRDNNLSTPSNAVTITPYRAGLDARPSNASCLAPARPASSASVAVNRAFGTLTFSNPVGGLQAPGDDDRMFIVERTGRVRVFDVDNPTNFTTFLDLTSLANDGGDQEAGLLGFAFHPDFAANGRVFAFYTAAASNPYTLQIRIAEFTAAPDRATAAAASERILLRANKSFTNHNGGQLAFGPDGHLYAAIGDGGSGGDPAGNAQNRNTLFGKIVRLDVDTGTPYGVPASNPFASNPLCTVSATNGSSTVSAPAACPEIYAFGLRNPWRFSFDRASAAPDLWVGDVGQNAYEEVNRIQSPGGNYGWDLREGPACFPASANCGTTDANGAPLVNPVAFAERSSGLVAIIGGHVYRGSAIPALTGRYVFTDFGTGGLYVHDSAVSSGYSTLLGSTGVTAGSFAEDNAGELYLLDYGGGGVYRIDAAAASTPSTIPADLRDTGCVAPTDPTQPAAGLIPYAPNAPFWSDGADKQRFMALPNGTQITVNPDGDLAFPNGTVLVKNFRLGGQLIETRLFMRHPDGVWAGYSYQWNGAQTQATLVPGGATAVHGGQTWSYPSEGQCLQCHTSAAGFSLGLEIPQLNGTLAYPATGRTANQIYTLNALAMLSPAQTQLPFQLPAYRDPYGTAGTIEERARAYLHTNCSQCHRPGGGSGVSMDLRYSIPLASTASCDVAPGRGTLGLTNARIIAPGNAAASVIVERMNRRDDGLQMPPIASNVIDAQGVQLMRDWINGLAGCN